MKRNESGILDRWVEVWKPNEITDSVGQIDKKYILHTKDWAGRKDNVSIKDNEIVRDGIQKISNGTTQFRFRYRTDLKSTMRIKDDGVYFEIVGEPIIDGRRHWVLLNCEQKNNLKHEI